MWVLIGWEWWIAGAADIGLTSASVEAKVEAKLVNNNLMFPQCPAPPTCCESGQYTYDECGCCQKCAKAELQTCGGASGISGKCGSGLQCLKTCCKFYILS